MIWPKKLKNLSQQTIVKNQYKSVSTGSEAVVELNDVSFAYNGLPILEQVNLVIPRLDSICIVGPNGGGKTTLLKLILGLLEPDHGKITVFGQTPLAARLSIGYVPQYAHYDPQFPVTVFDVALMGRLGRKFGGSYSKDDKKAATIALEQMDLLALKNHLFAEISGGQRQRVLIARALSCEAKLLIFDEPTANIDLQVEANFIEILEELNKTMTILLVTHDIGFVSTFFKSVACINRSVVVHPTSELTGDLIRDIYHGEIAMIRHNHRCSGGEGHRCV